VKLEALVEQELDLRGVIRIDKDSGLFVARRGKGRKPEAGVSSAASCGAVARARGPERN
jgi:hypothetical protein